MDEIEKQRFDREERYRIPKAKQEVMKEYQQAIFEEHMPKVSMEKKRELESLMQMSGSKP